MLVARAGLRAGRADGAHGTTGRLWWTCWSRRTTPPWPCRPRREQEPATLAADPATLARLAQKLSESTSPERTIFMAQLITAVGGEAAVPIVGQAVRGGDRRPAGRVAGRRAGGSRRAGRRGARAVRRAADPQRRTGATVGHRRPGADRRPARWPLPGGRRPPVGRSGDRGPAARPACPRDGGRSRPAGGGRTRAACTAERGRSAHPGAGPGRRGAGARRRLPAGCDPLARGWGRRGAAGGRAGRRDAGR